MKIMSKARNMCFFFAISMLLQIFSIVPCMKVFAASSLTDEIAESRADEIYQDAEQDLEAIYKKAVKQAKQVESESHKAGGSGKWVIKQFYVIYRTIKDAAVGIGSVSMLFGLILARVVRRNKKWSRDILLTFVVGVPVTLVVFCFGVGALIG